MARRSTNAQLPAFIEPMLATLHAPFDSDQHVFEIKWDGFRSLVFNDSEGLRLTGRRRTDFTERFPELQILAQLPRGTVLDGEIVQLKDGRPDFSSLLKRERAWHASTRPGFKRRFAPATFIAFDLLYEKGKPVLDVPLLDRLERLKRLISPVIGSQVAVSDMHVGGGLALFEEVNRRGLEGVIAKRIDSRYEPGQRSGAWTKFKRRQSAVCVIIGYQLNSARGLKSLLLATEVDGKMCFVGKVGTGIPSRVQDEILQKFGGKLSRHPIVPCTIDQAWWLEPGLFCRVSFAEWTNDHKLRQPVFEAMV